MEHAGECGTCILITLNEAVGASGKRDLISLSYLQDGPLRHPRLEKAGAPEAARLEFCGRFTGHMQSVLELRT